MMKNNIELKTFLLSVVITAALKVAYNISLVPVIIAVNVFSAGVLYYLLNRSEKINEHKIEENEKQNNKKQEEVIKLLQHKLKADEDSLVKVEILFNKIYEVNIEQREQAEKLRRSLDNQLHSVSVILNEVKLELEKENNSIEALTNVEKDSLDKLIDSKTILSSLEDKFGDIAQHLGEVKDISTEKSNLLAAIKSSTDKNFENIIESNEKIEESYKKVHQDSISELVKLASKNEYILNLLLDSYKVLKKIASTT
jgi:hypothetical protein